MIFTGARLLVVDDNPDNREMLSRRLKRLGYDNVSLAVDGEEALAMNSEAAFDAILLDVMMPRKSGIEVLEQLRSENRLEDTPVIMISAATEIETVVRCLELGAEDYLPKPFNPVLLRARLGSVLEKKALRAEVRRQLRRMEAEMAEARQQQLSMVPTEFPSDRRRRTDRRARGDASGTRGRRRSVRLFRIGCEHIVHCRWRCVGQGDARGAVHGTRAGACCAPQRCNLAQPPDSTLVPPTSRR